MLRNTASYDLLSHDIKVPDLQQHVVPPRSEAPSIPASEGPSYDRHMNKMFGLVSHYDDDYMNTQSLL